MEVTSLVFAILAVVVSAVAAFFAFRQATASRVQAIAARDQAEIARVQADAARDQANSARQQAASAQDQATIAREQAEAAHQQARAANEAVAIDRERLIAERTPQFEGSLEYEGPAGHPLKLRLASTRPLASFTLRILEAATVARFAHSESTTAENTLEYGRLEGGATALFWVLIDFPYPTQIGLEAVCLSDGTDESWTVIVSIPVFTDLQFSEPEFDASISLQYPPPHKLQLRLQSPSPLKRIEARIISGQGVRFGSRGASTDQGSTRARWDTLEAHKVAEWPLFVQESYDSALDLELLCVGPNEQKWIVSERIDLPDFLNRPGRPVFELSIREMSSAPHRLRIKLLSPWPLTSIAIAIANGFGVAFASPGDARNLRGPGLRRDQPEGRNRARIANGLLPGQTAECPLAINDHPSVFIGLNFLCTSENAEPVSVQQSFDIPQWLKARRRDT